MHGLSAIHEFLRDAHVAYTVVPHRPAYTAQEEAAAVHVPGRDWAKVVICFVDGEPIQAVLPAPLVVNLDRLLQLAGGETIRLARPDELRQLFPDAETGAMPPFGPLYHQPVFVDSALAAEPEIVFNAGTHTEAIRMRWVDFAVTVSPIICSFAERPVEAGGGQDCRTANRHPIDVAHVTPSPRRHRADADVAATAAGYPAISVTPPVRRSESGTTAGLRLHPVIETSTWRIT